MQQPAYPFREIEERQRVTWRSMPQGTGSLLQAAPASAPASDSASAGVSVPGHGAAPGAKHTVLSLPTPLGAESATYTELRRHVIADLYARLHRLQGHPVRFTAAYQGFTPEVESRAAAQKISPREAAKQEGDALRNLLGQVAVTIDSDAEVDLGRAEVCRWTQWLFLQLHQRGLVFWKPPRAPAESEPARWGDIEGPRPASPAAEGSAGALRSERRGPGRPDGWAGGWMLRLDPFCDRLLNDIDRTNWPVEEKKDQRYRIGRRRGCEVIFQASHAFRLEVDELPVFTTQVEAIYGATFILIHPWHPMLPLLLDPAYEDDVQRYRERIRRGIEPRISGMRTGGFALNPVNLKRLPILVSSLAMDSSAGGALIGIPAHNPDQFELARRLYLPIKEAIRGPGSRYDVKGALKEAYIGDGTLTNSSIFSGLPVKQARERVIPHLAKRGICERTTRFRLQEAPISHPGTWGVPVPLVHCRQCGVVPALEERLPIGAEPDGAALAAAAAAGVVAGGGSAGRVLTAGISTDRAPAAPSAAPHAARKGARAPSLRVACPACSQSAERDPQVISPWLADALACFFGTAGPQLASIPQEAAPGFDPSSQTLAFERGSGRVRVPQAFSGQMPDAAEAEEGSPDAYESFHADAAADPSGLAGPPAEPEQPKEVFPEDLELFGEVPVRPGHQKDARRRDDPGPTSKNPRRAAGKTPQARPGDGKAAGEGKEAGPPKTAPEEAAKDSSIEVLPADRAARPGEEPGEEKAQAGEEKAQPPGSPEDEAVEEDEDEEEPAPVYPESRYHPFRQDAIGFWLPAEAAFGRAEHGTPYLLLQRVVVKFLGDLGDVTFPEAFFRFLRVGSVRFPPPEPGARTGDAPSRGATPALGGSGPNVQREPFALSRPAAGLDRFGADAVRIALIGLTAPRRDGVLTYRSLQGARRFLDRIWRQVTLRAEKGKFVSRLVLEAKHLLIHNCTQRLKRFKFHTALAAIHEFLNFLEDPGTKEEEMDLSALRTFLIVLRPFAPHLAGELWGRVGGDEAASASMVWPEPNRELLRAGERTMPVRIDGRVCHRLKAPAGLEPDKLELLALREEKVQLALAGRHIAKVVAVPDRVVSIVTGTKPPPPLHPPAQHPPAPHPAAPPHSPGGSQEPQGSPALSNRAPK